MVALGLSGVALRGASQTVLLSLQGAPFRGACHVTCAYAILKDVLVRSGIVGRLGDVVVRFAPSGYTVYAMLTLPMRSSSVGLMVEPVTFFRIR
jgi:hypothetical protein